MNPRIKWSALDELCRTLSNEATAWVWLEDADGALRAGERPAQAELSATRPVEIQGSRLATVCARGPLAAAFSELLAELARREIEQQATLRDMAAATARLWRQTNAMLRMAASIQLTLDPASTVAGILSAIGKSTCFKRCTAVLRLPGQPNYVRLGAGGPAKFETTALVPLETVGTDVALTGDVELDERAVAACRTLSGFAGGCAVAQVATESERYGYLFAEFPEGNPPSSEDCKLLAAGAQILSVGVANGHTLARAKEATRRQVESKLYETLAKTVPVGIFRIDATGKRVTYVNEQWRAITGLDASGDVAAAWVAATHEEDRPAVVEAWRRAVERSEPFRVQYRIMRPDREERWVLGQAAAEYDSSGRVTGYVGSITDVTEQKRAEEEKDRLEAQLRQSQKMESLGVLAGGIAHDFNNILGAIIGSAELAIDKVDADSRVHRNLERILSGANRAKELVGQILAFSRQQPATGGPSDLAAVAKEAMTLARASIPTTIDLVAEIDESCPPVPADSTQLHQIIMNLCTNAYHAIGKGGGTIRVGVGQVSFENGGELPPGLGPGTYVCLSVSDTGCGMDEETKARIFDPFFTTKGVGEGTGLGLSVVHGIVTKAGGAITVDSAVGRGTTFRIFLPPCTSCEEGEQEDTDQAIESGGARVLLVDDEPELLATAREILEELGYSVTAFSSSREALEEFRRRPESFDVVVSDQTMPELTGADLFREMAAARSDLRFVVATGFSDTLSPAAARAMGMAGYIPKPYRARDLAKALARALSPQPLFAAAR